MNTKIPSLIALASMYHGDLFHVPKIYPALSLKERDQTEEEKQYFMDKAQKKRDRKAAKRI